MDKDLEQAIKTISKALESSSTRSSSSSAVFTGAKGDSTTSNLKNVDKSLKSLGGALKHLTKASDEITRGFKTDLELLKAKNRQSKTLSDVTRLFNQSMEESSKSLDELSELAQDLSRKSIPEQERALNTFSKTFGSVKKSGYALSDKLAKAARSSSLFSASMLTSHSEIDETSSHYRKHLEDLGDSAKNVDKSFLDMMGMLDEKTGELKDGLTSEQFAKFRIGLGESQAAFAELTGGIRNLGFGSFEEVLSKGETEIEKMIQDQSAAGQEFRSSVVNAAVTMQAKGFDVAPDILHPKGHEKAGEINEVAVQDLLNDSAKLKIVMGSLLSTSEKNQQVIDKFDHEAVLASTMLGGLVIKARNVKGVMTDMADKMASAATIMENFSKVKDGLKTIYAEMMSFNISQVPASFGAVQKASISMGMSFEDTVKFMQENKRVMGIYGDNFGSLTDDMKGTFAKFGYTMAQGAEVVGPAIEGAIASGVDVKNKDALNGFVADTMNSFKDISGIVNETAAEYAKQNAVMLQSTDIQSVLLGMDQQHAHAYANDLITLKNLYIQQGLSAEQASELVRATEAQKNAPVKDRIRSAGMQGVRAQMAGLSSQDVARIQELQLKGSTGHASGVEQKELFELQKKSQAGLFKKEQDILEQGGPGATQAVLGFQNQVQLTGELTPGEQQAATALAASRAGTAVTPEQAHAIKTAGSGALADIGNLVNTTESAANNAFTKVLWGAVSGMTGLTIQALRAARALGKLGGGGTGIPGVDKLVEKFGGKIEGVLGKTLGKMGKFGSVAAKVLGAVGIGTGEVLAKGVGEAALKTGGEELAKVGGKELVKGAEKVGGEELVKGAEKVGAKEGLELGIKGAEKVGAKSLGKSLLKKIPGIGILAGLAFGASRLMEGDYMGALLEVASGAVSTLPIVGTALSVVIDAGLAVSDIKNAMNPEATPAPGAVTAQVNALPAMQVPPTPTVPGLGPVVPEVNSSEAKEATSTGKAKIAAALAVSDKETHDKLGVLSDAMIDAINLLEQIASNGDPKALEALQKMSPQYKTSRIPSATSYLTGRAPTN